MSEEYDRAVSMGWGPATNAAPVDDLKERLRANHLDECYDAIDYIEAREAELAKAVEALTNIDALDPEGLVHGCSQWALAGLVLRMGEIARDTLEELKGED